MTDRELASEAIDLLTEFMCHKEGESLEDFRERVAEFLARVPHP
jgi:broad specificity phosphatase PhoE